MHLKAILTGFTIIFSQQLASGQSDSLVEIHIPFMGKCEDGIENAKNDIENGIIKTLVFGLMVADDWEFERYYRQFLKDSFGIEMLYMGCVIEEEAECYDSTMNAFILEEFGDDFFKKSRKTAFANYYNDSVIVLVNPTELPKFTYGTDSLMRFLEKNIRYQENSSGKIWASFVVEKDGSISNIKIEKGIHENMNNEIIRVLELMPNWIPGEEYGNVVRAKMYIPFNIND
jgi:hypothetical protein